MTEVHPEYQAGSGFSHLKLGKLAVKHDPRTLHLDAYLQPSALPPIPQAVDWTKKVSRWPMYGNDTLGDCTCAAAGHMVQAWTANATRIKTPRTTTVEHMYWETGTEDNGRVELDILNYWRHTGLGSDRIAAYVKVNPRNDAHMRAAIFLFGGVYVGIELPITAQTQAVWDVVRTSGNGAPGSWGGHAVPYLAYGLMQYTCVTWGAPLKLTQAFNDEYCDEAYAILSHDWMPTGGKAPSGFDFSALSADLAKL